MAGNFRGNIFIKTLNKNLRSSARSALSAGEYFLKKRISLFFILFISQTLFSLDFFIAPYTGVMFGKLGEYLYDSSDSYICSYLEWEEKPLCFIGLDAGLEYNNFQFDVAFDYTLPLACGKMYDNDWNEDGIKHTYSIFESNKNTLGLNTIINTQYSFPVTENFNITPALQLQYNYYSFEARNGIGYYGSEAYTGQPDVWWNDESAKKYRVSGIDYLRHTFFTWIGSNFDYNFGKHSIGLGLFVAPLTYTSAIDYHTDEKNLGRDYSLQEIQYSYFDRFKINFDYGYELNQKITFYINSNFLYGFNSKGHINTTYFTGRWHRIGQKSGCDFTNFIFQSKIKIKL